MAKNLDCVKIYFREFVSIFNGLMDENPRDAPNKCIFRMLDVNNSGTLSIMELIQILSNTQ